MVATGHVDGPRSGAPTINIQAILLSVRRPTFLKSVCLFGGGDTKSTGRQDHGANANVRFRSRANVPTLPASENWRVDVSLGSNSLERPVQIVTQLDDFFERHARMLL
jgi:hypothetical protein